MTRKVAEFRSEETQYAMQPTMIEPQMRRQPLLAVAFTATTLIGVALTPPAVAKDIQLQVGIVQRFGEEAKDELTIASTQGDALTLRFKDGSGQSQTLQAKQVKLEVSPQSLPTSTLEERVVLSDHATFETAEDSANQWQQRGIQVEVAQPERWQVWAKRSAYSSPLVRRWLLQSLQAKGYSQSYLDTALVSEKPQVSFTLNGSRYSPERLEVAPTKNPIQVTEGKNSTHTYGGSLTLQPNAYGTYTLVNSVSLETYLRGVVPHEIGSGAPFNAAKAQTIIARTYALRNLRRFQADGYQLSADTHCQVYYGLSGTNAEADRAIAETKSLVLTYQNELVDALYSSTTGGVTATFSDVWNGEERPYLRSVIDSPQNVWNLSQQPLASEGAFRQFMSLKDGFNEDGRSVFRWNRQATLEQLAKDLKEYLARRKHPLANFTAIQNLTVTERSPSGRVLTLKVQTDRGEIALYKNEIRSAFTPPRSTLFYLEPITDPKTKELKGYAFIGGGLGHGVGLSQYGSYNLAKLGWSAEQILTFYYPGTKIQPLNDTIVFWEDRQAGKISKR
jgi:SpoIID/LytB domain protein